MGSGRGDEERATATGTPPPWLFELTDDDLSAAFGYPTFARGSAYSREGAVRVVRASREGSVLLAQVDGSGPSPYQTLVTGPRSGRCSCPMRADCKHVVAVLLAARDRYRGRDAGAASGWAEMLGAIVAPQPIEPHRAELALQIEVVQASRSGLPRLRIRPKTRGKRGWVKTGASWRELEHGGYYGPRIDPRQRAWIRETLAVARSHLPSYYGSYVDLQVHLDDLGPAGWRLLAEAQECGFTLIGEGGSAVDLSSDPGCPMIDARRREDGAVELTTTVRSRGGDLLPADAWLVGDPAHGAAVSTDAGLLLVAIDPPIDATVRPLIAHSPVIVPAAEVGRFLTEFYPALSRQLTVVSTDASVDLPEVEPPRLGVHVSFEPGHVASVETAFVYRTGEHARRISPDDPLPDPVRDIGAEHLLAARYDVLDLLPGLRTHSPDGPRLTPFVTVHGLQTAELVERVIPKLAADGDVELTTSGDSAAYGEAAAPPLVTVAIRDGEADDPDWFDLDIAVSVDGQNVPFAPLFTAMSLGEDRLLLDSGTWFRLDRPELVRLRELIEEAKTLQDRPGSGLRLTPIQAGFWDELVSLGVVTQQSERWQRSAGALLALRDLPCPEPPPGLRAVLRPYQLEGYQWLSLLWDLQLGGVLADDMGLGKTVQTLAMAVRAAANGTLGAEHGPLLVVTPTSVMAGWAGQAARFAPDLDVRTIAETERRRGRPVAELAEGADVVITSFALFRIDEAAFRSVRWSGLVLDEAQFVKNHQAKTYQCARRLSAPFKLAITGTPMENSLMDLWSMLSITAPGLFPNPQRFNDEFRRPIERGGAADRLDTLRRRVRPLMLRRTKEDVAADLPPKTEQVIEVTLNPQHRRIYDTHLNRERQRVMHLVEDMDRNRLTILRSLTLLRQLSLDASLVDEEHAGKVRSSKIDALVDQLREIAAEGHRALVFSQFTRFLSLIRTRLTEEGLGHCYLDGRTRDRAARIAEFTEGDAPVFLISLKAGGFGLNLTAADYVFVLDPWWNPAAEEQAIDRTHRIGQDKPVMVYRLVATDTIEEKVVALQERKRDLFAQVVDGGAAASGALTAADIRELFAS